VGRSPEATCWGQKMDWNGVERGFQGDPVLGNAHHLPDEFLASGQHSLLLG